MSDWSQSQPLAGRYRIERERASHSVHRST